ETSTSRPSSSATVSGAKRGSSSAALTATRAISSASGRRHSSVPIQPRSRPSRLSVTKAPTARGNSPVSVTGARATPTAPLTASRASSTSAVFCGSVNTFERPERAGQIADHAAVITGDLARVHVGEHAAVARAAGAGRQHDRYQGPAAARDEAPAFALWILLEDP